MATKRNYHDASDTKRNCKHLERSMIMLGTVDIWGIPLRALP
jgi:hypothetical protein